MSRSKPRRSGSRWRWRSPLSCGTPLSGPSRSTSTRPPAERPLLAAILFTFALGTSAGDQIAEQYGLGYFCFHPDFCRGDRARRAGALQVQAGAVTAFWVAYILTRPLELQSVTGCPNRPRTGSGPWNHRRPASSSWPRSRLVIYPSVTKVDQTHRRSSRAEMEETGGGGGGRLVRRQLGTPERSG